MTSNTDPEIGRAGKTRRQAEPGGPYADALSAAELARFAAGASLADEVLLLRVQVYRLARTIDLEDAANGLKQLRVLAEMIRTIAALERVRLMTSAREAASFAGLAKIMAAVKPKAGL